MIKLLSRLFVRDYKNTSDPAVRRAYGVLCSIVGICLNILLFAGKYIAGSVSGSIAITADAFNNLSDAGSSLITLVGFKFAGMKPDSGHPFGHGRIEYISGFVVAIAILLMAYELGSSAIAKIIAPEPAEFSWLAVVILAASICVKLYMFVYNRRIGKKLSSVAMKATASDSLGDFIATSVVLLATLLSPVVGNIDGWCGLVVALFILYSGINAARDTLSPLLGAAPDPDLVHAIERMTMEHSEIIGIHDLVVHDYGPGRLMISLHAEVPGSGDIYALHEVIDDLEQELNAALGCEAVIHMDPICTDDNEVTRMCETVTELVHDVDPRLSIHDFRMVAGPNHSKLIFDAVIPLGSGLKPESVQRRVTERIAEHLPGCTPVIKIDNAYV